MPIRVHIKDFQSIKDSVVIIDGLTVITGQNNSGKTAVMRAILGLFTNAPAGPLVRHGSAFLMVELTFDDGTVVRWEKGWEKPNQKGGTVNRYHINGMLLSGVGRGAPPEVAALGVCPIQAASDRVWPQVAQQFDGTLFLVNRPGSAVAEALSDVEKVGKLTRALKLSEKDRRASNNELTVRRKDLEGLKDDVQKYTGLEDVRTQVATLTIQESQVDAFEFQLAQVMELRLSLTSAQEQVDTLKDFDPRVVPDQKCAVRVRRHSKLIEAVVGLRDRRNQAGGEVERLASFDPSVVPLSKASQEIQGLSITLAESLALRVRLENASGEVSRLQGRMPTIPDGGAAESLRKELNQALELQRRVKEALEQVEQVEAEAKTIDTEYGDAKQEVFDLLGDLGECPTCGTVHEPGQHVGGA
jgi:DNA repair ATPase RecN